MAEIKNAFIKSKMNKDLDARLVPSGEYRNAMNISISQSEGGDVGAVENIKGNELKVDLGLNETAPDLGVIGYLMDDQNNCIYVFSTDQNVSTNTNVAIDAKCFIHKYNANTSTVTKLVEGSFLNFSKQNFISGVNLLEDLLFFTDNRNQPRVIDVSKAALNSNYYNTEENISVAKIAPFKPISILNTNNETVSVVTNTTTFEVNNTIDPVIFAGDFITRGDTKIGIVVSYANPVVVYTPLTTISVSDVLTFSRSNMVNRTQEFLDTFNGKQTASTVLNPNYNANWDGDPDFIKDKFIRFAYRYKFDNNQYSIISPFTATMFIPKQFGYFVGDDEKRTYKSSIVGFMENYAEEMVLKIPFPTKNPTTDYKIEEVDIIYKESDGLALQVLSTLQLQTIESTEYKGDDNYYYFTYESKKPYKTLPEDDLIRVYDRVPIKAKTQEIVGNRLVYGNYIDKNNFPNSIKYYIGAQEKDYGRYDNTAQYPYHSLKQSRTYQLGFVLSDKYGRSSSVILSSKDINAGELGRGSTYFHQYTTSADNSPLDHPYGDALRITVEEAIKEIPTSSYPGTYANSTGKLWNVTPLSTATINANTYTIDQDLTTKLSIGDSMRGKYVDYVEITSITEDAGTTTIVTSDQIADYYADTPIADLTVFGYTINPMGWYSYKVVVKQTEQEYYNVYAPGIINGGFKQTNTDTNQSAQMVLINDNINKIPRDLSEVGPQQKKFRSSVRLYGRVTPTYVQDATSNEQWYPAKTSDNVSEIADATDLGYDTTLPDIYDYDSNPLIAKIATITTNVGGNQISIGSLPGTADPQTFYLGVYETTPVETRLELFYETSTAGLISDLNKDVSNTVDSGATGVVEYTWALSESDEATVLNPFDCTTDFKFINSAGTELDEIDIPTLPRISSVKNGNNATISPSPFKLVAGSVLGTFKIQTTSTFTYVDGSETANYYYFTLQVTTATGVVTSVLTEGGLTNANASFTTSGQAVSLTIGDTNVVDFTSPLTVTNGSSIVGEKTDGLIYTINSQQRVLPSPPTAVSNFGFNGSQLEIVDQTGLVENQQYNVQVQIADAGGSDPNTTTAVNDLVITVGAEPINYTGTPLSAGGNGCIESTSNQRKNIRIITFGTSDLTSLPTENIDYTNATNYMAQADPLTSGTLRFNLTVLGTSCGTSSSTARFLTFIQFRANSSSSWVSATDNLSVAWPTNGKYIYFTNFASGSVSEFLGDFDQAGQYRIVINPDDSVNVNSICGADGIPGPCVEDLQNELDYCDAVYDGC